LRRYGRTASVVPVRCQDVLPASIGDTVVRAIRQLNINWKPELW
jgi:hypothetical protein